MLVDTFLIVKLDQYAGNVDEIVCTALTGRGNGRYGKEQARKVFDAKVYPLLSTDEDLPVEFVTFATEYGSSMYDLDYAWTDNLRLCIDADTTSGALIDMLDIWHKAYGNADGTLTITVDDIHRKSVTVKILGFDLVEVVETRKKLR